jgi:predicted RND superfamily exporter protein
MAYAFRRACRAMAVTSSTTSVAFFANIFSPVMPIRSFGIISGVIIPLNYLFVVVFMPPAVIFYEEKLEGTWCCIKTLKQKQKEVHREMVKGQVTEDQELRRLERFFDGKWNNFTKKFKYFIIFFTLAWFGFAIS